MADLAGNAMTSTIVGTCILSAILSATTTSWPSTRRPSTRAPSAAAPWAARRQEGRAGAGALPGTPRTRAAASSRNGAPRSRDPSPTPTTARPLGRRARARRDGCSGPGSAPTLPALLREASLSARMCVSEGRDGLAEDILKCADCGGTVSRGCKGWPEHSKLEPMVEKRMLPTDFEATLKAHLPMCLQMRGLADSASGPGQARRESRRRRRGREQGRRQEDEPPDTPTAAVAATPSSAPSEPKRKSRWASAPSSRRRSATDAAAGGGRSPTRSLQEEAARGKSADDALWQGWQDASARSTAPLLLPLDDARRGWTAT